VAVVFLLIIHLIEKFILDIALWLEFGNASDDPTSFAERLY
jgi:hypothetical protein